MKTTIAALAAALAQRAAAVTFPTLTTIYVETGVRDDGQGINAGIATNFKLQQCERRFCPDSFSDTWA